MGTRLFLYKKVKLIGGKPYVFVRGESIKENAARLANSCRKEGNLARVINTSDEKHKMYEVFEHKPSRRRKSKL